MTTVYHISNEGTISEFATYSLNPIEALKACYLQNVMKTHNTWDYDKRNIKVNEGKHGYNIFFGDNEAYYTKKVN